jgi:hypothetical protein
MRILAAKRSMVDPVFETVTLEDGTWRFVKSHAHVERSRRWQHVAFAAASAFWVIVSLWAPPSRSAWSLTDLVGLILAACASRACVNAERHRRRRWIRREFALSPVDLFFSEDPAPARQHRDLRADGESMGWITGVVVILWDEADVARMKMRFHRYELAVVAGHRALVVAGPIFEGHAMAAAQRIIDAIGGTIPVSRSAVQRMPAPLMIYLLWLVTFMPAILGMRADPLSYRDALVAGATCLAALVDVIAVHANVEAFAPGAHLTYGLDVKPATPASGPSYGQALALWFIVHALLLALVLGLIGPRLRDDPSPEVAPFTQQTGRGPPKAG